MPIVVPPVLDVICIRIWSESVVTPNHRSLIDGRKGTTFLGCFPASSGEQGLWLTITGSSTGSA